MNKPSRNIIGGAVFLLLGIGSLYAGRGLDVGSLLVPGSGALPKIVLLIMSLLALILILSGRWSAKASEPQALEDESRQALPESGAYLKIALTIAAILVFVLVLPSLGFFLCSSILMALLSGIGAEKLGSVRAILIGLITAAATYFLFVKALGLPLPNGSLWST